MATVSIPHCVFRFFKLLQDQEQLFDILYGTISSICSICFIANEYSIARLVSGKACISLYGENGVFPGGSLIPRPTSARHFIAGGMIGLVSTASILGSICRLQETNQIA